MSPRPRSFGEGAFPDFGFDVRVDLQATGMATLRQTIPALPVRNAAAAVDFIAGTASCRIAVEGVDALYEEMRESDVLHPVSKDAVETTAFGTREFGTLDLDGNLVTFFQWTES